MQSVLLMIVTFQLSAVLGFQLIRENSPVLFITCIGASPAVNATIYRNTYVESLGEFQWVEVKNDIDTTVSVNLGNPPSITLSSKIPTALNDSGEYECRFQTTTRVETNRTTIYAVPTGRLCITPDNDKNSCRSLASPVGLGENVQIACKFASYPLPTVQWYRGGIPADVQKAVKATKKSDASTAGVQVQVQASTISPPQASVTPSASATTASVVRNSTNQVEVLDKAGRPTQRAQGLYKFGKFKNVSHAILILDSVTLADRDKYICVIANEFGTASIETNLHIYNPLAFIVPLVVVVAEAIIIVIAIIAYELYRRSKKNADSDETQTQAVSTADSAAAAPTTENEGLRHR